MNAANPLLSLVLVITLPVVALGQGNDRELETVLQRVRERVKQHYLDLKSLAWTDTARQEISGDAKILQIEGEKE